MSKKYIKSMLFVPAHKKNFFLLLNKTSSDCVVFDLEDSVPINQKEHARKNLVNIEKKISPKKSFLRINYDLKYLNSDLKLFCRSKFSAIVLPKIKSSLDIRKIEKKILKLKKDKKFKIFVLVETAEAIINLKEICKSSKRISGLIFGAEDFLNDMNTIGFNRDVNLDYPRSVIPIYAHAYGMDAIESPYLNLKDKKGYKRYLTKAKSYGYTGILNVHPSQCVLANKLFYPTKKEFAVSKLIINSNKKLKYQNQNISVLKNKLVGPPMIKRAKKILEFLK